jgi:RNA polymerase sigma factor (sigma-70 family)
MECRRLLGNPSVVSDAIRIVGLRRRLRGDDLDEWRQWAWVWLLRNEGRLENRFRGGCGPKTFLVAVLTHTFIDWCRERRRFWSNQLEPLEAAQRTLHVLSARAFHDAAAMAAADELMAVRCGQIVRALDGLTGPDRDLIVAHVLAERPLTELADLTGCSPAAMYQRLHRALARLRKAVAPPPAEPNVHEAA